MLRSILLKILTLIVLLQQFMAFPESIIHPAVFVWNRWQHTFKGMEYFFSFVKAAFTDT